MVTNSESLLHFTPFSPIFRTYIFYLSMYDLLSVVTTCTRLRVSYIDTCIPCSLLIILLLLLSSTIFTIGLYYIVQLLPNATDKSLKLKIWFVSRDLCDRFQPEGELLQRSKPRSTTFLHWSLIFEPCYEDVVKSAHWGCGGREWGTRMRRTIREWRTLWDGRVGIGSEENKSTVGSWCNINTSWTPVSLNSSNPMIVNLLHPLRSSITRGLPSTFFLLPRSSIPTPLLYQYYRFLSSINLTTFSVTSFQNALAQMKTFNPISEAGNKSLSRVQIVV